MKGLMYVGLGGIIQSIRVISHTGNSFLTDG